MKFTVPYKMKSQKYHTVGIVLKYHTVGIVLKYHTVGIVPNSNRRLVERGKNDTLIHKYMTAHLPGLIQVF
jgi:hypothetical protein